MNRWNLVNLSFRKVVENWGQMKDRNKRINDVAVSNLCFETLTDSESNQKQAQWKTKNDISRFYYLK